MTVTELLAKFANPEIMESLAISDKIQAGLITTVLGMGITFTALVVLLFIISWMNKILNPQKNSPTSTTAAEAATEPDSAIDDATSQQHNDCELVAAITTAIAMTLKTSSSNIVIKNIKKVEDNSPAWNRAGIIEQMNSRF
ncbi:MAG: OadG family protein [Desulfobulbaceae bacterium]|nr:OadG family protein [Desulfobulbaceae bacterium]